MSEAALSFYGPEPHDDAMPFVRRGKDGLAELDFVVQGMHCAGCMQRIEHGLGELPGVAAARANLSTKRVHVRWEPAKADAGAIGRALEALGFEAAPFDPKLMEAVDAHESKTLLRAMGVAGFAAANVMLLSVSVWSGLASDMEAETRLLFHWLSAMIALPAVAYAGRPFFKSAWSALKVRALNMDVPISLAVLLAAGMSLAETVRGAEHVYFDASVSLLFFLLIGRYLDLWARARASSAAQNLLGLRAVAATVVEPDGTRRTLPLEALRPGMRVAVPAGMRVPADGTVEAGTSSLDLSLITGESVPETVSPGAPVFAGTLNLSAPITVTVTRRDEESTLAEIVRLMETAEQGRAGYVRLADRAARMYAPVVHVLALGTFVLWLALGAGWHTGLTNAIAVLIVTCPCALALAVPVVQVVASGRLLRGGILVKSGDALERLADIDTIVFDKTGTLTEGKPELVGGAEIATGDLALAAALARESRHPLAAALAAHADGIPLPAIRDVREEPGQGLEASFGGETVRLGSRSWVAHNDGAAVPDHPGPEIWLRRGGEPLVRFRFSDRLRPDAGETVATLRRQGLAIELLSGDRPRVVEAAAAALGIGRWSARTSPANKIARLDALHEDGAKTLMVGDGLNDAPALRSAQVSMSPSSAADISQIAADFVFQGRHLRPVVEALHVARASRRLVSENFALTLAYNAIAVPLAVAGYVTPLIAAIAMSASSLTVTLNALRLNRGAAPRRPREP